MFWFSFWCSSSPGFPSSRFASIFCLRRFGVVPVDLRWTRTLVDLIHRVISFKSTRAHISGQIFFLGEKPSFYSRSEIHIDWQSLRRLSLRDSSPSSLWPSGSNLVEVGFDLAKNRLILNLGRLFSGAPVLSQGHRSWHRWPPVRSEVLPFAPLRRVHRAEHQWWPVRAVLVQSRPSPTTAAVARTVVTGVHWLGYTGHGLQRVALLSVLAEEHWRYPVWWRVLSTEATSVA
jgi:hypothetical protein